MGQDRWADAQADERPSRERGGASHSLVAAYKECVRALADNEKLKA